MFVYVLPALKFYRTIQRCDGARPICNQCTRASVVDCEYTDNGPTASQILEENVSELEARIRAIQGGPAPIVLHNPHDTYEARRRNSVGQNISPETVGTSQLMYVTLHTMIVVTAERWTCLSACSPS